MSAIELDPWYVTGFCEGEAAFTYSRAGGSFAVAFSIKLREDNKKLLEEIWEYFEYVGKIYYCKPAEPRERSGATKASACYRVTMAEELAIIASHFDKYPLHGEKKRQAFEIWKKMVTHKLENYRNINYDVLRKLAQELSSLNQKSRAFIVHKR
jgi:hypothetical protein